MEVVVSHCRVPSGSVVLVAWSPLAGASLARSAASARRRWRRSAVPLDGRTLDLTNKVQLFQPAGRPRSRCRPRRAPTASSAASRCARRNAAALQLGGVRARQQRRRADRPAAGGAAFPARRLGPLLARPRRIAHRQHHAEPGLRAGPPAEPGGRRLPHHARSRRRRHLRRRTAHAATCRSSISGTPTPTRTRSTATRSIAASCSASPACSRSS